MSHFRLVLYRTNDDNKYVSSERHEYFGNQADIWDLWFLLHKDLKFKHVEVFSTDGRKLKPELGLFEGMADYNI
jgi:hypothetical protein